jgi:nitrogen fixation protein NifQ
MDILTDIPADRRREYAGLLELLLSHASQDDSAAGAVADRIARGSLRDGHLWRAMELESRQELRDLFETHFPELAAGNTKDMRWKKYLYKRLCGWPGFEG